MVKKRSRKRKPSASSYTPVYVENRHVVVIQGVHGEYMARGWVRGISVPKAPCGYRIEANMLDGKGWFTLAKSKNKRIDFSTQIDETTRARFERPTIRKALPATWRKQVINLYPIPRLRIVFDQPPNIANFVVKQFWFILLNRECQPKHNNLFNDDLPEEEDERRMTYARLVRESPYQLPTVNL